MQNFLEAVLQLRQWERMYFPNGAWRISSEVVITVAAFHLANRTLSIKSLQGLLPYSPRSIKSAVDELIADGWCEMTHAELDRRVKFIRGTAKLLHLIDQYEARFRQVVSS